MCSGWVPWRAAVASHISGYALAVMEYLDRPRRGPGVHLLADQAMRHGVEKALDFDVMVNADAGQMPLGILGNRPAGAPA